MSSVDHLVWLDTETTGLGDDRELLEIAACVVPVSWLRFPVLDGVWYHAVVQWSGDIDGLDPVVRDMHTANGLWDEVAGATLSAEEAVEDFATFLTVNAGSFAFAGVGVSMFDVPWLDRHSSWVRRRRKYWTLDVSPTRRLAELSGLELPPELKSESTHRAVDDVRSAMRQAAVFAEILSGSLQPS